MVTTIYTDCAHCGATFGQPYDPGRRQDCSGRCRTAGYRARQRRQQHADANQERQQRNDDQQRARRQRERARQRASQPPPHPGTTRPGTWCGACGGLRGRPHHPPRRRRPPARPPPLRGPARQSRLHRLPARGHRLPRQGRAAPRQVRPALAHHHPAATDETTHRPWPPGPPARHQPNVTSRVQLLHEFRSPIAHGA